MKYINYLLIVSLMCLLLVGCGKDSKLKNEKDSLEQVPSSDKTKETDMTYDGTLVATITYESGVREEDTFYLKEDQVVSEKRKITYMDEESANEEYQKKFTDASVNKDVSKNGLIVSYTIVKSIWKDTTITEMTKYLTSRGWKIL